MKHEIFDKANDAWEAGNYELALKLFVLAAKKGDKYAFNTIGYFFDEGIGVEVDKDQALKWYKKAARYGDSAGCINLAVFYKNKNNIRRAIFWFLRAFQLGDASAALELGKIFFAQKSNKALAKSKYFLEEVIKSVQIQEEEKEEAFTLLKKLDYSSN